MTLFAALGAPVGLRLAAHEQQQHRGKLRHYTITNLGTLGGTFSEGVGVNNRGLVSGNSTLPGDLVVHAFLWEKGVMADLGTLGGPSSKTPEAWPPNNSGEVPGYSDTLTPDPNKENFCAFVTGFGNTDNTCLPLVWHNGGITPLPLLGGNNGIANAVNNRSEQAGVAETNLPDPNCVPPLVLHFEPVFWRKDQPQQLRLVNGDSDGFVQGINDQGDAVGWTGPCFPVHAVLWEKGKPIDLGSLGGAVFCF
jgi:probable HAF family extracellular repeat protein